MVLVIYPMAYHQARLYATNRSRTHIGEVFDVQIEHSSGFSLYGNPAV